MPDFSMILIAHHENAAVITGQAVPMAAGGGNFNYFCGGCDCKMLESIQHKKISGVVLKCPVCHQLNSPDLVVDKNRPRIDPKNLKRRKIRCEGCVHTNLVLACTGPITTVEFMSPGMGTEAINADKYIYLVICAKCKRRDMCILPL